jgi:hypothetical protein
VAGVDADADVRVEGLDDRDDAPELLGHGHRLGPGPRRLTTDVDDGGALGHHRQAVLHGGGMVEPQPAVGEGVRGDVQHAHHERHRITDPG